MAGRCRAMSVHVAEQHERCIVVAEYNKYGSMTLQSNRGKTYQIVATASHQVTQQLARLAVDDVTRVSLRQAPGRGNTWRAIAVGSAEPQTELHS